MGVSVPFRRRNDSRAAHVFRMIKVLNTQKCAAATVRHCQQRVQHTSRVWRLAWLDVAAAPNAKVINNDVKMRGWMALVLSSSCTQWAIKLRSKAWILSQNFPIFPLCCGRCTLIDMLGKNVEFLRMHLQQRRLIGQFVVARFLKLCNKLEAIRH